MLREDAHADTIRTGCTQNANAVMPVVSSVCEVDVDSKRARWGRLGPAGNGGRDIRPADRSRSGVKRTVPRKVGNVARAVLAWLTTDEGDPFVLLGGVMKRTIDNVLKRLRAEFLEMPGLQLTVDPSATPVRCRADDLSVGTCRAGGRQGAVHEHGRTLYALGAPGAYDTNGAQRRRAHQTGIVTLRPDVFQLTGR